MSERKIVDYDFTLSHLATDVDPPQVFSLEGIDEITIAATGVLGATWVTSTATFEVSGNGAKWDDLPTGAVTFTAVGLKSPISVSAYRFGRIRVSTGASSAFRARYVIHGEGA